MASVLNNLFGSLTSGLTAGNLIGGLGNTLSGGQQAKANADADALGQGLNGVTAPTADQLSFQLQNLVNAGQLDPQMAATISANPSLMSKIQTDPALAQAQMSALTSLQNIGASNGMDAQAQAALNQAQNNTSNYERGQRLSLLQNAAQQGISNSNLSFASQLANQQGAATQLSQAGVQAAADAQQRALASLQGGANLAGNIQAQSFNQQSQQAQAQDAINRFNAQNAQNVALTNTGAYNTAQAANLANAQNISNTNTQFANQTLAQRAAAQQQAYQNQLGLSQAHDAAAQQKSNIALGIGNSNTALSGALIKAGATAAAPTSGASAAAAAG